MASDSVEHLKKVGLYAISSLMLTKTSNKTILQTLGKNCTIVYTHVGPRGPLNQDLMVLAAV